MTKNLADLRLAVDTLELGHPLVWRLWITQKADIYFSSRGMHGILKVSFHQSGIARYAFTHEHAFAHRIEDRPLHRWIAPAVPAARSDQFARLAWIALPTDYLSCGPVPDASKLTRIPAARPGSAALVELGLTRDPEETVFAGTAVVASAGFLLHRRLYDDISVFVRWQHSDWKNNDLRMPASHGLNAYRFLADEVDCPQRPVRMTLQNCPVDGEALLITELGGCADAA